MKKDRWPQSIADKGESEGGSSGPLGDPFGHSTYIQVGSRSTNWETQGALLLYGPKDLREETDRT